jgi:dTDP-glucose 4,6-dehydratase
MKVLITGAAGFIGSHLTDYYLARGDEVIAIDNLITGRKENLAVHFGQPSFTYREIDICDFGTREWKTDSAGGVDLILDFASPASPFDYLKYPIETMRTAALGTINMLEYARAQNAAILLASTSEVYGDPEMHPQREDYWGNVNPVGPRSVYDEGKRFAEALTAAYHRQYEVKTRIVRIFNTYGERMREGDGRVIPALITQALRNQPMTIFGDGSQTRSFCYVSDMVRGLERLAETDYDRPVNMGNPAEYTVLQLAETIKRLTGSTSPLIFQPLPQDDPRKRKPDITRAKELLGWEPRVNLEEGLNCVIDWFQTRI